MLVVGDGHDVVVLSGVNKGYLDEEHSKITEECCDVTVECEGADAK